MSYRTLKRLIGETNFELKCLLLFGTGLTLLAVGTFFLYGWQTSSLIDQQTRTTARSLVAKLVLDTHWKWDATNPQFEGMIEELSADVLPENLRKHKEELIHPDPSAPGVDAKYRPSDDRGYEALGKLRAGASEVVKLVRSENQYEYYAALYASESCLSCHTHQFRVDADGQETRREKGEFLGAAKITLPLDSVQASLHSTNAFVISAEMLKVVLAIVSIYLVLRYVVTKKVLHLKKVSDAIAHGKLDMRADIRSGDEFEELGHAFNRMLRHLVTVQEELRNVNVDLDGKVDELARVNLRLYELNNLKNEFLATMSHELRTPLNSILGFSDVLQTADNLSDKQKRYVTNIQSSGRNLMSLINDILDLAKIESGKLELHLVEFSLADMIERQTGAMTPMAEKKNIDLSWHTDPQVPVLFQDVGKLQQVLNNLLSNAIKFTPEGGRVRVRAGLHNDSHVFLAVEDTGVGIPLEEQERIFEKFRQGRLQPGQEDAMARQFEGTGLGLSIVKELCKLLSGEVSLISEFGKGSTFTIVLPIRVEASLATIEDTLVRSVTSSLNPLKPDELNQRLAGSAKAV
ncbi:MAG TPA: ATP-binding protein [Planctomycetaceae bacterium]|nr:ATP-binding protein [Planctomycetaceae bacterium]